MSSALASLVSSRCSFLESHPQAKLSFDEFDHELNRLKVRERVGAFVAVVATAVVVLGAAGIVGGGMFLSGALAAVAIFAAIYTHGNREAESFLRNKYVAWVNGGNAAKPLPKVAEMPAAQKSLWECVRDLYTGQ